MLIIDVHGLPANYPGVQYVGREYGKWVGSSLGSPIHIGKKCDVCGETHRTSGSTLSCYRTWLKAKIDSRDEDVLAALRSLKEDSVLGCWCCTAAEGRSHEKRRCHAEIVAAAWRWCKEKGLLEEVIEQDLVSSPTE